MRPGQRKAKPRPRRRPLDSSRRRKVSKREPLRSLLRRKLANKVSIASFAVAGIFAWVGIRFAPKFDAHVATGLYPFLRQIYALTDGFFQQKMAEGARKMRSNIPKPEAPSAAKPN